MQALASGGAGAASQMQMIQNGGNQKGDTTGQGSTYSFRDSGDEIEITFKQDIIDKKKVKVQFKPSALLVCYDGQEIFGQHVCKSDQGPTTEVSPASAGGGSEATPLAIELYGSVETDESSWSIVDKTKLQITLMKRSAQKWPHVLK